jgi:hypothetical protein
MKNLNSNSPHPHFTHVSNDYLLLSGEVYLGYSLAFGTDIELFHKDELIQKYVCCNNGYFYFRLEYENTYKLTASKPGYKTKSVIFNTHLNGVAVKKREYAFGISMIEQDSTIVNSNKEIPVAIIEFNSKHQCFEHNKDYQAALNNGSINKKAA